MDRQTADAATVRVLIIDDDELMLRVVNAALAALECDVVGEAHDGKTGLDLYRQTAPDLVLLDIVMPEMSGLEVLAKLKEIDENANVVMLTSVEHESAIEDAMIGGAKDYLRKNMPVQEMVTRLERHVTRSSTTR